MEGVRKAVSGALSQSVSETAERQTTHGRIDEGFTPGCEIFVIFAHPPTSLLSLDSETGAKSPPGDSRPLYAAVHDASRYRSLIDPSARKRSRVAAGKGAIDTT